jgi:hypothetical protein
MLAGDIEALEELLADSLVFISQTGAVFSKQADLDAHRSGVIRLSLIDPAEQRIVRHDGMAVVTVRTRVAGHFAGAAFDGRYRYLRVWMLVNERWQVVAGCVTEIVD